MEDNEPSVESAPEPKIDHRFGTKDRKVQSSSAIKIGIVTTISALGVVLVMRTPVKQIPNSHEEVKAPETSQMGMTNPNLKFDPYSAPAENEKNKEQEKKRPATTALARLPGLQKIDRRHTGDIPPGSMVKAVLLTGASNGTVKAEIKEPLQVQGETLVPAGATVIGTGQSTDERLIVHFKQVVFSDGSFSSIDAQAADVSDQIAGLHGSTVGSYAVKYAAAIGLNFVGGMAQGLQDHDIVNAQVVNRPDAKNALLNGTSQATLELANTTMSNIKSKPPVIEVPAGKEILVIFDKAP